MQKYLFLDFSEFLVCYVKHLMQPVYKISSLCKFVLSVFLIRFDYMKKLVRKNQLSINHASHLKKIKRLKSLEKAEVYLEYMRVCFCVLANILNGFIAI